MTKFASSLLAFSAGLVALKQVQAGVTIYEPVPTDPALQPPSVDQPKVIGVSAIAIASGGATQYAATEVATAFVIGETTVTFSPSTYVVSFEQGASTYHVSQAITTTILGHGVALSEEIDCGPGNGGLNCVENAAVSVQGASQTSSAVTFVATESPIFTITGSTGPLPTGKSSAMHTTPFMVSASLFMGFVYALVRTL